MVRCKFMHLKKADIQPVERLTLILPKVVNKCKHITRTMGWKLIVNKPIRILREQTIFLLKWCKLWKPFIIFWLYYSMILTYSKIIYNIIPVYKNWAWTEYSGHCTFLCCLSSKWYGVQITAHLHLYSINIPTQKYWKITKMQRICTNL